MLSLRLLLYSLVVNPWYFLPIELLNGLSHGIFYPNMISYASSIAPKGAQATVQGIVKSVFILGEMSFDFFPVMNHDLQMVK